MTTKREDRRIRRTRKLLQDALIELLRQKPLAKIRITEIVDEADVSRPTFYHHFDTKEDLLFSHVDDVFEKIRDDVFAELDRGEVADLQQLLITSFEHWLQNEEALRWVLQVSNKDLLIIALRTHIETLKDEYERSEPPTTLLPQLDDYAADFVAGGLYMLLRGWIGNGLQESPETMGSLAHQLISSEHLQQRYQQMHNTH